MGQRRIAWVRALTLAAFAFAAAALIFSWWRVEATTATETGLVFEAEAFRSTSHHPEGKYQTALDAGVFGVGLLLVGAVVALCASQVVAHLRAWEALWLRPWRAQIPSLAALALAAAAAVWAMGAWPGAWQAQVLAENPESAPDALTGHWWGDADARGEGGEPLTLHYRPGIGWWAAWATVATLGAAAVMDVAGSPHSRPPWAPQRRPLRPSPTGPQADASGRPRRPSAREPQP